MRPTSSAAPSGRSSRRIIRDRCTLSSSTITAAMVPPLWVADPNSRTAAAAGGCMVIRHAALERIGGIDSIRGEIIDDCALARRVKANGRVWLGIARGTESIREYGSWRPIWDMIARCAFAQLGYSALALIGMVLALTVIFAMPPL